MKSTEKKPIDRCPVMNTLQGKVAKSQAVAQADGAAVVVDSGPLAIRSLKRAGLLFVGLLLVFLAAVGVVLPGIPTAGPLILASICLAKSCPWLEERLVRSRFFAPFHRYLDSTAEMPWRAKVIAIGMMWTAIIISSIVLVRSDRVADWVVAALVVSGVVGTIAIARFRRNVQAG